MLSDPKKAAAAAVFLAGALAVVFLGAKRNFELGNEGVLGALLGNPKYADTESEPDTSDKTEYKTIAGGDLNWAKANAPDFKVSTPEQLAGVTAYVNRYVTQNYLYGDYQYLTIELQNDIDLSGWIWEPMGTQSTNADHSFTGMINGNGHTISNMNISKPSGSDTGFIGAGGSVTVKDITFKDAKVAARGDTGIICGGGDASPKDFTNVTVSGTMWSVAPSKHVGALSGYNPNGDFVNCTCNVFYDTQSYNFFTGEDKLRDDVAKGGYEQYTLTLNDDLTITRSSTPDYINPSWVIIRNGERILGRGCDDELTLDLFSIIDDDLGEYEIYIEAYLNSTYAPCSNTIKFRLVYDPSVYDADSDIPQFAKHMGSDNEIPLEITRDQAGNVVCEDPSLADHYDTDKLMWMIYLNDDLLKIVDYKDMPAFSLTKALSDLNLESGEYKVWLAENKGDNSNIQALRLSNVITYDINTDG